MKVRCELSGMDQSSENDYSIEQINTSTSTSTSANSTDDSQLVNNPGCKATNAREHNTNEQQQHITAKNKRRSNHKKQRGRDSHTNLNNVTDRSSRRQSGYKQQLSALDQEFLGKKNRTSPHQDSHTDMKVTTSTPKDANGPRGKHLSDSELRAMGIEPGSEYASEVKRKYSMTE